MKVSLRIRFFGILWGWLFSWAFAQQQDSLLWKGDTIRLTQQNLIPFQETILIGDSILPKTDYEVIYFSGKII
ncbi:MAG: hypothetical protein NZ108_10875, partial [Bacteroidia bacterium]|nr:hypothetical protein [Bacteroidia bacterium]